jgi:hypothetical protein
VVSSAASTMTLFLEMVLDLVVSSSGFLEMVGAFSKIDAIQKNSKLIQTESDEDKLHIKVVCIVEIYNLYFLLSKL